MTSARIAQMERDLQSSFQLHIDKCCQAFKEDLTSKIMASLHETIASLAPAVLALSPDDGGGGGAIDNTGSFACVESREPGAPRNRVKAKIRSKILTTSKTQVHCSSAEASYKKANEDVGQGTGDSMTEPKVSPNSFDTGAFHVESSATTKLISLPAFDKSDRFNGVRLMEVGSLESVEELCLGASSEESVSISADQLSLANDKVERLEVTMVMAPMCKSDFDTSADRPAVTQADNNTVASRALEYERKLSQSKKKPKKPDPHAKKKGGDSGGRHTTTTNTSMPLLKILADFKPESDEPEPVGASLSPSPPKSPTAPTLPKEPRKEIRRPRRRYTPEPAVVVKKTSKTSAVVPQRPQLKPIASRKAKSSSEPALSKSPTMLLRKKSSLQFVPKSTITTAPAAAAAALSAPTPKRKPMNIIERNRAKIAEMSKRNRDKKDTNTVPERKVTSPTRYNSSNGNNNSNSRSNSPDNRSNLPMTARRPSSRSTLQRPESLRNQKRGTLQGAAVARTMSINTLKPSNSNSRIPRHKYLAKSPPTSPTPAPQQQQKQKPAVTKTDANGNYVSPYSCRRSSGSPRKLEKIALMNAYKTKEATKRDGCDETPPPSDGYAGSSNSSSRKFIVRSRVLCDHDSSGLMKHSGDVRKRVKKQPLPAIGELKESVAQMTISLTSSESDADAESPSASSSDSAPKKVAELDDIKDMTPETTIDDNKDNNDNDDDNTEETDDNKSSDNDNSDSGSEAEALKSGKKSVSFAAELNQFRQITPRCSSSSSSDDEDDFSRIHDELDSLDVSGADVLNAESFDDDVFAKAAADDDSLDFVQGDSATAAAGDDAAATDSKMQCNDAEEEGITSSLASFENNERVCLNAAYVEAYDGMFTK